MNKKYFIISVVILALAGIIFVSWYMYSSTQFNCPETKLHDFNQKVENKDEAINLFKQFFSEENGYPSFNVSKVYEYKDSEERYIYVDRYDYSGVGGVLYENGKLVKKGYCK